MLFNIVLKVLASKICIIIICIIMISLKLKTAYLEISGNQLKSYWNQYINLGIKQIFHSDWLLNKSTINSSENIIKISIIAILLIINNTGTNKNMEDL